MITKVKFKSLEELIQAQELATELNADVGIHSSDGTFIDIKTFLGALGQVMMNGTVSVVSEDEEYHKQLAKIVKEWESC